jgi:hypothetical protein
MIGDAGHTSPAPEALVVLDHVAARIGQLDLLVEERDGDLGTRFQEVAPLLGIGRVGGDAHRELQAELYLASRGFVVQVAEDAFGMGWILGVDVVSDPGLQIRGDFGATPPQLSLRALGQVGPLDAQGR